MTSFFKSIDKGINIIFILSLMIILLIDLYLDDMPEIFSGGDNLLNTSYNICIGYTVSYIFYVLVVHRKEYVEKKHINSIVFPKIENLLKTYEFTISTLLENLDKNEYTKGILSKEQIKNCFERLDPNNMVFTSKNPESPDYNKKKAIYSPYSKDHAHNHRSYLLSIGIHFKNRIDDIQKIMFMLEPELAKILLNIYNCPFVSCSLDTIQYNIDSKNLASEVNNFTKFSLLCIELDDYYQSKKELHKV